MTTFDVLVEVSLRAGIADPQGATVERSLPRLGFAEVHGTIQRGHAAPLREILTRAVERGQLPSDTDTSQLISAPWA